MDGWKQIFERWPRAAIYILAIYAIGYSVYFAYETYRKNLYEAEHSYVQGIFDQCLAASDTTARIATATSRPEKDIADFWALYYGKLVVIENEAVAGAMREFGESVRQKVSFQSDVGDTKLINLALTVSGACRDLIKSSWGLSIAPWSTLETKHPAICASVKCG